MIGIHATDIRVKVPKPPASRLPKGAGSGPGGQQKSGRLWFGDNRKVGVVGKMTQFLNQEDLCGGLSSKSESSEVYDFRSRQNQAGQKTGQSSAPIGRAG